jgi:hypothetical protein
MVDRQMKAELGEQPKQKKKLHNSSASKKVNREDERNGKILFFRV